MNYKIKKITLDECEIYLKINLQCWNESYKNIISSNFLNKINKEINQTIDIKKSKFNLSTKNEYLLIVNDKPVGMTSVGKSRIDKYENCGELYSIYILNEYKNKGYGKILFKHDIKILKKLGYKSMIIGCLKENNKANGFYQHMGGKIDFVRTINIGEQQLEENIYYFEKI